MAEELVVKEQLSAEHIAAGDEFTDLLRRDSGFGLVCSFWLYSSETNRWRLNLSSPLVETHGPLHMYRILQEKLAGLEDIYEALPLDSISVLSPDDELVKSIQTLGHFEIMDPAPGAKGLARRPRRIHRSRVGDVLIDDAFIYFIQ